MRQWPVGRGSFLGVRKICGARSPKNLIERTFRLCLRIKQIQHNWKPSQSSNTKLAREPKTSLNHSNKRKENSPNQKLPPAIEIKEQIDWPIRPNKKDKQEKTSD